MDPVKTFKDLEKHFAAVAPERRIAVVCPSDDHTCEVVERCLNEFGSRLTLCCCDSPEWADSLASANPDAINVIRCGSADDAARAAVSEVRAGRADVVMKGAINTDNLLRAVLDKQNGLLEPGHVLSHLTAAEIPNYHKMLFFSDAAVIPQPDLHQLESIINYDTDVMRSLHIKEIRIALIHFTEKTNPKFINTVYYGQLKQMNTEDHFGASTIIEGPMDVKTACDRHSAEIKHIDSKVAGNADLLIFPDLVSANTFYKTISLFCKATMAGMICGASAPIVIPSRADSAISKFYSLALACTALK